MEIEKYQEFEKKKQLKIEIEKENRKKAIEERIQKMDRDREQKQMLWKQQQKIHQDLTHKKPLYLKLQENFDQEQQQKAQELKEKHDEEKLTKFRPILKEELDEFSQKCELIVSHMNQERKAQRDRQVENNFDPK